MYTPTREEFVAAAARGNLIPVYRELLADSDTPVSAYAALSPREHSFLLESVLGGANWAAYSFVGIEPRAVVRWQDGVVAVTWYDVDGNGPPKIAEWPIADPIAALGEVLGELTPVTMPGLPRFWGGAVGWIAYDCVRAFEQLPARARGGIPLPPLYMVLTDTLLIFDNLRQTLKVVATPYVARADLAGPIYDRACARIDAIVATLRAPRLALPILTPPQPGEHYEVPPSSFTRAAFCAAVDQVKEYILAGDAFQVVLSQRFAEPAAGARPLDVYRALRVINPSPYMFHLDFPEASVTGASPETLVRLSDNRVEVRPIAGTRPRGRTVLEDEQLASELLADPKERAEHLMLIDLGRNDVGRVAAIGTVQVTEQMEIERYSHVMHMTSHVVGEPRRRQELARRTARGVPGRHALGRAEDPRDGDHRRARAPSARHLRRRSRLRQLHRQPRSRDRDPHAGQPRGHDLRAGRRWPRRRFGARARVRRDGEQGPRGAARGRDGTHGRW